MIEVFYINKRGDVMSVYHPGYDASKDKIVSLARKKDGREIQVISVVTYGDRKYRASYLEQHYPFCQYYSYNPVEKTYVKDKNI
jgi:hypothetical protein